MLYLTTREKYDACTTTKSLQGDTGADGGLFVPFQLPSFSAEELSDLAKMNFGQCTAKILNLFFSCRLTGWDVDFAVGRHPVKVKDIQHNVLAAELWHNADNRFDRLESALAQRILETAGAGTVTSWLRIAIRIAVLFGTYGQAVRCGLLPVQEKLDISVTTGDFLWPMTAWYARAMGLPVENIICGCNENSAVWELLHLGEVRTDLPKRKTDTPEADVALPPELERLICAALGQAEARRFSQVCAAGGIFAPKPGMLEQLRKGMFAAVISKERLGALIPNVYSTTGYILGPYSALAYGGLLDYRTKNRENRPALLIAQKSPVSDGEYTAAAMNLTETKLKEMLGAY